MRLARVLVVVAGVLYLGTPLEALLGFPLDPSRSYLSELGASDQPLGWLFRTADALTAILVLAAVALLWKQALSRLAQLAVAGLGVFAVGTLADVIFPMACASSANVVCARADAAGTLSLAHQLHTVSSATALSAIVFSAIVLLIGVLRSSPASSRFLCGSVVALVAALLLSSLAISVAAVAGASDGLLPEGAGYIQRVQTLFIGVYLVGAPGLLSRCVPRRPVAVA